MDICGCLLVGISWACPLLYVFTYPLEEFKARGVKKDSVPDMIKVELTYVPIKGGIVYSNVLLSFQESVSVFMMSLHSSPMSP